MNVEKTAKLSLLVSLGLILFVLESFVPLPLPWMKLGIANIVSIIALYVYGMRDALVVTIYRVVLGCLIRGTLFNPIFFVALGSGVTAVLVMGVVRAVFGKLFSPVGVSIWGAFAFNITQLVIFYFVIIKKIELFHLLPFLVMITPVTGFVTGFTALLVLEKGKGKISF